VKLLPWVNFAAGRRGAPKVSFLASRPIHTPGQELPVANDCSPDMQLCGRMAFRSSDEGRHPLRSSRHIRL